MQLHLHLSNHHFHRPIPTDCRDLRTENMTSCFFCPKAPSLEHSKHSVDACRIKQWFLWDTSLQCLFLSRGKFQHSAPSNPWSIAPSFLAGLSRRTMALLFPDSQACTSQSWLPRRWRASGSAGPLAPLFQLLCTCFPWQKEALSHHFIFHL